MRDGTDTAIDAALDCAASAQHPFWAYYHRLRLYIIRQDRALIRDTGTAIAQLLNADMRPVQGDSIGKLIKHALRQWRKVLLLLLTADKSTVLEAAPTDDERTSALLYLGNMAAASPNYESALAILEPLNDLGFLWPEAELLWAALRIDAERIDNRVKAALDRAVSLWRPVLGGTIIASGFIWHVATMSPPPRIAVAVSTILSSEVMSLLPIAQACIANRDILGATAILDPLLNAGIRDPNINLLWRACKSTLDEPAWISISHWITLRQYCRRFGAIIIVFVFISLERTMCALAKAEPRLPNFSTHAKL